MSTRNLAPAKPNSPQRFRSDTIIRPASSLTQDESPKTLEEWAETDEAIAFEDEEVNNETVDTMTIRLHASKSRTLLLSGDLDSVFDEEPEDRSGIAEMERQNTILEELLADMELMKAASSEEELEHLGSGILGALEDHHFLRDKLASSRGIVILTEILSSRDQRLLEFAFPLMLAACQGHFELLKGLCLLGALPVLFEYSTKRPYSPRVQEDSLRLLFFICTVKSRKNKSKPLRMFIAAGGLPKLAMILRRFSHQERPQITPIVLEIVRAVFCLKSATPSSCFARLLSQGDAVELLAQRFHLLRSDDPSMPLLCAIFEAFSIGFSIVKWKLAVPVLLNGFLER
jgi:hypothetical protein